LGKKKTKSKHNNKVPMALLTDSGFQRNIFALKEKNSLNFEK
jgi:hypothetical protein